MSRANEPAFPVVETVARDIGSHDHIVTIADTYSSGGLTIREHFAGLAMQAILSSDVAMKTYDDFSAFSVSRGVWVARQATAAADALIAELERTK